MRAFCISIDVERDYRADGQKSIRGIDEGLPAFLDLLRSHGLPFDLMVSGEVASEVPLDTNASFNSLMALGCHGFSHVPGYLNRMDRAAQMADLRAGTNEVRLRFDQLPIGFRAPNFSADGDTIQILQELGYRCDSSVLPGRYVRRWRMFPLVDHRGAPENPYVPDLERFPMPGSSRILEIPVTPNPALPGGPLGLGFLNARGPETFFRALSATTGRYAVMLAHTWEMVSWSSSDPVAPWVRSAARSDVSLFEELLSKIDGYEFLNSRQIVERETRPLGAT